MSCNKRRHPSGASRGRQLDMLAVDMMVAFTLWQSPKLPELLIHFPQFLQPQQCCSVRVETASYYSQPSSNPPLVSLQSFIQNRLIVTWLAIEEKGIGKQRCQQFYQTGTPMERIWQAQMGFTTAVEQHMQTASGSSWEWTCWQRQWMKQTFPQRRRSKSMFPAE